MVTSLFVGRAKDRRMAYHRPMAASRPVEVRQHLIAALRADLVGPFLPESGFPRSRSQM